MDRNYSSAMAIFTYRRRVFFRRKTQEVERYLAEIAVFNRPPFLLSKIYANINKPNQVQGCYVWAAPPSLRDTSVRARLAVKTHNYYAHTFYINIFVIGFRAECSSANAFLFIDGF